MHAGECRPGTRWTWNPPLRSDPAHGDRRQRAQEPGFPKSLSTARSSRMRRSSFFTQMRPFPFDWIPAFAEMSGRQFIRPGLALQLLRRMRGEIGEDAIGAGALECDQALHDCAIAVDPAVVRR